MPVIMSEESDSECIHLLYPASCATCQHGVLPEQPKKKPRKAKRRQVSKPAPADLAEKFLMEFLSGARCLRCETLRSGAAFQCVCERNAIAEERIGEIEAFAAANSDVKGKLVQTSVAAAISRVTARAGLRNLPSEIDGLSLGSLIGLANRASFGRAMEWNDRRPSGDPMPV